MTGGIDQVDQELVTLDLLGDIGQILLILQVSIQGNRSRLDGNTTILLIGTSICETRLSCL